MSTLLQIHGDSGSGNCLKVVWAAKHLGIPFAWHEVSVALDRSESRVTRQAAFLAMNPFGEVPVVVLPDGRPLAQSNAIIRYLARGSALLPDDAYSQAKIDEWLFWEQYSHEPYIAVCRFQMKYAGRSAFEREGWRVERGEKALDLLDTRLTSRKFLVGESVSIADIALVAYTRWAHEGGFDLGTRPHVRAWIFRCEAALDITSDQSAAA